MSATVGDLDIERPGSNRDAVTSYTYNGDGTINTKVVTYTVNGVTTTYTKTYTYTAGAITGISKWVVS